MEDFKILFVFVICEIWSGFNLSATLHIFLSLHRPHFSFIFSFFVLLMLFSMIVFPPIISLRFLVRLKDIIGSPSNVLPIFFVYHGNRAVFFHDLGNVESVVRYCKRIDIVAVLGFGKYDISWDITCLFNFFVHVIRFILNKFLYKSNRFILKRSHPRTELFQS